MRREDPYSNFNFLIEIDGNTLGGFSICSELGATGDLIECSEDSESTTVRKVPGLRKFSNITLTKGFSASTELYNWYRNVVEGDMQRRNGSIIVLDGNRQQKARWIFFNAFPTKWGGPEFCAKGTDIAIETLELAHEGLERA